jgi:hypothetical protein
MTSFDPDRILRALVAHEVRFVIVGGVAGNLRGTADITNDLDVCYARDRENLERLSAALTELGARLRGRGVPDDVPFVLDALTLLHGDTFTFATAAGDFDVLATPSGTRGYDDLDAGATSFDLGDGITVRVTSLDDLIRMKRASARSKDLIHIEHLGALKDQIEEFSDEGGDPQQGT